MISGFLSFQPWSCFPPHRIRNVCKRVVVLALALLAVQIHFTGAAPVPPDFFQGIQLIFNPSPLGPQQNNAEPSFSPGPDLDLPPIFTPHTTPTMDAQLDEDQEAVFMTPTVSGEPSSDLVALPTDGAHPHNNGHAPNGDGDTADAEDDEDDNNAHESADESPWPLAPTPTVTVGGGGGRVCVDATYLRNYPRRSLVHAEHVLADVLCPSHPSLPCATAYHMVRHNGRPLSYAQYCHQHNATCARGRMAVNSVWSHKWIDEDHGDGLHLTMFDARYSETAQRGLHRLLLWHRVLADVLHNTLVQ